MLEDKTTETRQDEPAGAPRHTGFRAKLRSLWAQLQCVHLLRRHRRDRRRLNGRRGLIACLLHSAQKRGGQIQFFKCHGSPIIIP